MYNIRYHWMRFFVCFFFRNEDQKNYTFLKKKITKNQELCSNYSLMNELYAELNVNSFILLENIADLGRVVVSLPFSSFT